MGTLTERIERKVFKMLHFRRDWYFVLLALLVVLAGCVPAIIARKSGTTQVAQTEEQKTEPKVNKLAVLQLNLPKTTFAVNEKIPVDVVLKAGEFLNLWIPKSTIEGAGAFAGLVVKKVSGEEIKSPKPIKVVSTTETLYREGEPVKCIPGTQFNPGSELNASLDNLLNYYPLTQPGTYSVQVIMNLKVYICEEALEKQSEEVRQLEADIASFKKDTKLAAGPKQEAISYLQTLIAEEKARAKPSDEKYIPLDSFKGATDIKSNTVEFTITL